MRDRTKVMFAQALEEMLETTDLDKVRVTALCKRCGATTPTFYYYFHDKYELVAWMFLQDFAGQVGDRDPGYDPEGLNQVTVTMARRRTFYQKAFDDHSQNSISKYLQDFNMQISRDAVRHLTGGELTPDQEFAVKYHVYGIMGMFREWLYGGAMTTEYLTTMLFERTPDFLKEAFAAYPFSTEDLLRHAGKDTKADR